MSKTGLLLVFVLILVFNISVLYSQADPDPVRFEEQINSFRQWDLKNSLPKEYVLFVGSSSIRMWNTAARFPDFSVVNRGFGGSHMSDMLYYIDDIALKYPAPKCVVFYCGDNDIAGGKIPERILDDYKKFVGQVREQFPHVQFIYVPAKPSLKRWNMWHNMQTLNALIKSYSDSSDLLYYADTATPMLGADGRPKPDLFIEDGLHLSEKGYDLWTTIVNSKLKNVLK